MISEVDDFSRDANTAAVKIIEMDEQQLNQGLRNLAKRTLPELPNAFKAGVWRSIRARSSPGSTVSRLIFAETMQEVAPLTNLHRPFQRTQKQTEAPSTTC
jgi:hypothetical protein